TRSSSPKAIASRPPKSWASASARSIAKSRNTISTDPHGYYDGGLTNAWSRRLSLATDSRESDSPSRRRDRRKTQARSGHPLPLPWAAGLRRHLFPADAAQHRNRKSDRPFQRQPGDFQVDELFAARAGRVPCPHFYGRGDYPGKGQPDV